jgi:hypothetical protein
MPIHFDGDLVHAMSPHELSRVRTELDPLRIFPIVSPHPVQPNCDSSGHGHLGNVSLPTHCQVHVPPSPLRITTGRYLCCFYQQETQQGAALFGDVPQPLMACTGILFRDQSHIAADLLAALEPLRSSYDQHEGQGRQRSYAGMCHQPQHFGPFPGFLLHHRS